MSDLWLAERARSFGDREAVAAPEGVFNYSDLLLASARSAHALREHADRESLDGARVCFLVSPGFGHLAVQWGIWRAGGVSVPLATSHPPPELAYVIDDVDSDVLVVQGKLRHRLEDTARSRGISLLDPADLLGNGSPGGRLPAVEPDHPAMILYTSGTTGSPKGAVITHGNIQAQVESLSEAWGWSRRDRVLLHLPLHHVHGVVNVLTCSCWNGAVCEILPRFTAVDVWERLSRAEITLYMGVPTTYRRLVDTWTRSDTDSRSAWSSGAGACRLMVSGSAALPVPLLRRWEKITGQRLCERYGMTEIGMALSNPLDGVRRAGRVGTPLPGVEVRLVDDDGEPAPAGEAGELQVRGPTVFPGYWRREQETAEAFTADGWFKTGDIASVDEAGYHLILGRSDQDILKTGGEKISALEIEGVLRQHPAVRDCAVVGVGDDDWGDRVCAAVVREPPRPVSAGELVAFVKDRLAPYKVPKEVVIVASLPRNSLGKVAKPAVRELFVGGEESDPT